MLELEQLLAQGYNNVAVGRIGVDFESVLAVVSVFIVGHCSVSVLIFKGVLCLCWLVSQLVCFFVCFCVMNDAKTK